MPRKNRVKKGGSRASNAVMSLNPKVCMDYISPVIEGPPINYNINDLSLYRTTGGGKRTKRQQRRKSQRRKSQRRQSQRHGRKVGGSRASNAVMALGGKPCNATNKLRGGSTLHAAINNCSVHNMESTMEDSNQSSSSNDPASSESIDVVGFNLNGDPCLHNHAIPLRGGGSDWKMVNYSRGPVNTPDMDKAQFRAFTQSGNYVPMESLRGTKLLKGGYKKSKSKKSKRKGTKKYRKKGGGSDWRSTVYSRGSYTAPNMDSSQFRAFTKTADYVPNESMRTAAFMR